MESLHPHPHHQCKWVPHLKNVLSSFDEQDKCFSERIVVNQPSTPFEVCAPIRGKLPLAFPKGNLSKWWLKEQKTQQAQKGVNFYF